MTDTPEERCDTLLMAVVQSQDAELVENIFQEMGISLTRLPSTGAFLGRRNATLLIGIPSHLQPRMLEVLQENCRQRVEYIAVPLESAPLPVPAPTPIPVGGATVFALEVDHFEEL